MRNPILVAAFTAALLALPPSATAVRADVVAGAPAPSDCVGDCAGEGSVRINDIVVMVNIVLGALPLDACPAPSSIARRTFGIADIILAVNNALDGCPCGFTGPRMCGGRCPNASDVCRPAPEDSGCSCQPVEPPPTATGDARPTPSPTPAYTQRKVECGYEGGSFSAECCDHNCYLCAIFSENACCQTYVDICDWTLFD